jgi:hypothetical protein
VRGARDAVTCAARTQGKSGPRAFSKRKKIHRNAKQRLFSVLFSAPK